MKNSNKMFSRLAISLMLAAVFVSCKQKPAYLGVRHGVLELHDTLMIVSSRAMTVKMALDTLNLAALKKSEPKLDTLNERGQIKTLIEGLEKVDDRMSDWMHEFKEDYKGEEDNDAMIYFSNEKLKIERLAGSYKTRIDAGEQFLKRFGIVIPQVKAHHMSM